jgi:hypothetical protein
MIGAHKLDYPCRVLSDSCGSMAHVKTMATRIGIDHAYIPPHQQSLNEAEKVADHIKLLGFETQLQTFLCVFIKGVPQIQPLTYVDLWLRSSKKWVANPPSYYV